MNCKQGDLAVIIKGYHTGETVTCLEYLGKVRILTDWPPVNLRGDNYWRIDKEVGFKTISRITGEVIVENNRPYVPDDWLMPIRPEDLSEEERSAIHGEGVAEKTAAARKRIKEKIKELKSE